MFCVIIDFHRLSRDHMIRFENGFHHWIQREISVNLNIILKNRICFVLLSIFIDYLVITWSDSKMVFTIEFSMKFHEIKKKTCNFAKNHLCFALGSGYAADSAMEGPRSVPRVQRDVIRYSLTRVWGRSKDTVTRWRDLVPGQLCRLSRPEYCWWLGRSSTGVSGRDWESKILRNKKS